MLRFFKSSWTILYPWKVLRTAKQTGNVASVQNGCARTNLSRQFK